MDKISTKLCDACGKYKVRTLCYECREAYCQDCSDYHLRFKATRDHSLIDLEPRYDQNQTEITPECTTETESSSDFLPSAKETESSEKSELSSDFLEHLTVTENTVLYRAQAAVEGRMTGSKREVPRGVRNADSKDGDSMNSKCNDSFQITVDRRVKDADARWTGHQTLPENPAAKQSKSCMLAILLEIDSDDDKFSIGRSEDKESACITGIVVISDKVIVSDSGNEQLKLFDTDGKYMSSTDSKHHAWGITIVSNNRFVTCGLDDNLYLWTLRGETIAAEEVSYKIYHYSHGINYNSTYYCVVDRDNSAITVLDTQGRKVRKIIIKEAFGKKIRFGLDIHMDRKTHNIYVTCVLDNRGVLCVSVEGEPLWFSPLTGLPWGITTIHGLLCVTDRREQCVHLMSKTGEYKGKLLDEDEMTDPSRCVYYDDRQQKLYFSLYHKDIICYVSVKTTD